MTINAKSMYHGYRLSIIKWGQCVVRLSSPIEIPTPDFIICDHAGEQHTRGSLSGENGLLIGFVPGIWSIDNFRHVLWLQQHMPKLAMAGIRTVVMARAETHTLYEFRINSPLLITIPLLGDSDGAIHAMCCSEREPTMVLIDRDGIALQSWSMGTNHQHSRMSELGYAIQSIQSLKNVYIV